MNSPDDYRIDDKQRGRFQSNGWVHLRGVLSAAELDQLEPDYQRFIRGEIPVAGRDLCDMSGDYGRKLDDFDLINVMLPSKYHPAWRDHVYERRAASIARQLAGPDLVMDYDQLLAKRPGKSNAVFHWHQDLAYWPATADTRTVTLWLALDDSTEANGCMRFVTGSHHEPELRPHRPLLDSRDQSHTLVAEVDETNDRIELAEISRGDVTVHCERVIHGSGGNYSDRWRRAYVIAFRSQATVDQERALGFTHSHNDDPGVLKALSQRDQDS